MNFFSMDFKLLSICLVLLAALPTSYGQGSSKESGEPGDYPRQLQCHQCDSKVNQACADPFANEDGSLKTNEFLEVCGEDDTVCTKSWQNEDGHHGHHGTVVSVVRGCGKAGHVGCQHGVCNCDTDGCNSGSMFSVSSLAMFSALVLALYSMQ